MNAKELLEIAVRQGINPKEGIRKYGNVSFADEKNKKYPIHDKAHVRAALRYWGMPKNRGKYSGTDQEVIGSKIHQAAKKFGVGVSNQKEDFKMVKAVDVTESVKSFLELVPTQVFINRVGGGDWIVTEETTKEQLGTFSSYDDLEAFLRRVGAYAIPEDILNQAEVKNYELPVEIEKVDYFRNPTKQSAI
jgi:hypothetical protein